MHALVLVANTRLGLVSIVAEGQKVRNTQNDSEKLHFSNEKSTMVRATLDYGTLPQVSKEFCGRDDVYTIHLAAVLVK